MSNLRVKKEEFATELLVFEDTPARSGKWKGRGAEHMAKSADGLQLSSFGLAQLSFGCVFLTSQLNFFGMRRRRFRGIHLGMGFLACAN